MSLDVVRGIAVLLVMFDHMPASTTPPSSWMASLAQTLGDVGWVGVDLFFVLSGFLISRLLYQELERTGTLQLGRFWLRRGFKIWPSYFVAYGAMVALWVVSNRAFGMGDGQDRTMIAHLPYNVFFIQNYFPLNWRWPHSWSLAIEEHFYIVLPIVLFFTNRLRGVKAVRGRFPSLFSVGIAFCAATLLGRLLTVFVWPHPSAEHAFLSTYYPTHLRADGLVMGVMLGYAAHEGSTVFERLSKYAGVVVALAVGCVSIVYFLPVTTAPFTYTVGFSLLAIAFTGIVGLAYARPAGGTIGPAWRTAVPRAVAFIGVYSYTIYLSHSVVPNLPGYLRAQTLARDAFGSSIWTDRAFFFVMSIASGIVLSHLVERPALKLRARLLPSAVPSASANQAS